jgi:hypothetical protein
MPRGPQVRSLDPKPRCDGDLKEPFSFLVFGDLVVGNLTMSLFPVGQTKESFIYSLFSCCVIRIYSLLYSDQSWWLCLTSGTQPILFWPNANYIPLEAHVVYGLYQFDFDNP